MRITEPQPYSRTGVTAAAGPGPLLGSVSFAFTVPKTPEEQHDKPLDLGALKATFLKP